MGRGKNLKRIGIESNGMEGKTPSSFVSYLKKKNGHNRKKKIGCQLIHQL